VDADSVSEENCVEMVPGPGAPPSAFDCSSCLQFGLSNPLCPPSGAPVYGNACLAACQGADLDTLQPEFCPAPTTTPPPTTTAPAPTTTVAPPAVTTPAGPCSVCDAFAYDPTCPPSGAPVYANACVGACSGADLSVLSPANCPFVSCSDRCSDFGFSPVCPAAGNPIYGNLCLAECEGADIAELRPEFCPGGAPAPPGPPTDPPGVDCSACADLGYAPVCPPGGGVLYGNQCLAACAGADVSSLSPENCPGAGPRPTPPAPQVTTEAPELDCATCAEQGFAPLCPPSGSPLYGNPCIAACAGVDLATLDPANCPPGSVPGPAITSAPTPQTTAAPTTTSAPETTAGPTTTPAPETTTAPGPVVTTAVPETTAAPLTTPAPETTAAPMTTSAPETTSAPGPVITTAAPATTPSPTPPATTGETCETLCADGEFEPVCPAAGMPIFGNLCLATCSGLNADEVSRENCPF